MTFWSCPPLWSGETCFIVAGGPSLSGFDFERLEGRKVIAVNSSAYSVPDAPIIFFGDDRWGYEHAAQIDAMKGEIVTVSQSGGGIRRAKLMKKIAPPPALMERRDALSMRRTSLQAAINLALHLDVARIVLLGADMKPAEDGRTHHHRAHRWPQVPGCWDEMLDDLRGVAAELQRLQKEIVNTSLDSRIDFWPKQSVDEFLD
jgi:hypothetical protein